jgi:hypothetical protein
MTGLLERLAARRKRLKGDSVARLAAATLSLA